MTDRDVITVDEATTLLPLSRRAIYERIRKGQLPGFKLGRSTFMRVSEIDAWLSAYKAEEAPERKPRINPRFFGK
jgi:excisionase family DNA binding protein